MACRGGLDSTRPQRWSRSDRVAAAPARCDASSCVALVITGGRAYVSLDARPRSRKGAATTRCTRPRADSLVARAREPTPSSARPRSNFGSRGPRARRRERRRHPRAARATARVRTSLRSARPRRWRPNSRPHGGGSDGVLTGADTSPPSRRRRSLRGCPAGRLHRAAHSRRRRGRQRGGRAARSVGPRPPPPLARQPPPVERAVRAHAGDGAATQTSPWPRPRRSSFAVASLARPRARADGHVSARFRRRSPQAGAAPAVGARQWRWARRAGGGWLAPPARSWARKGMGGGGWGVGGLGPLPPARPRFPRSRAAVRGAPRGARRGC